MRYITQQQLDAFMSDRSLLQLIDKDGLIEEINEDAAGEIDGYLRGIYTLPLQEPVDRMLTTICGDIMKFRLHKRRFDKTMPEPVLELYKMAVKKLERIQERKITLSIAGTDTAPDGGSDSGLGTIRYHTPTQKFPNHFTGLDGL